MNIEGLDYNTQRERLVLPEYGREIQNMVDMAVALPSREERQKAAKSIVEVMARMVPGHRESEGYEQKLWDHLALMSNFKLDIDYPYDIDQAKYIAAKPAPMAYPMQHIPVRHYGKMLSDTFEKLKTMPAGPERDQLARMTANQMKRDLYQWGHGSVEDQKVAADLERLTDGAVRLDLSTFKFNKISERDFQEKRKKRK